MSRDKRPLLERFESSYIPEPNSGCWLWNTGGESRGYGLMHIGYNEGRRKVERAHRVSWKLHHGDIPDGLFVLHKCDVSFCVNPSHLFLGTGADNAKDRDKKGRAAHPRGESHPGAKVTDEQIAEIRRAPKRWGLLKELAEKFGVSASSIHRIRSKKLWSHI